MHIQNAHALDEIVSTYGWPSEAVVGKEGAYDAWFIANHSICTPALLRKFVALIKSAYEKGDVPKKQYFLIRDQLHFREGKPQIVGFLFDWQSDGTIGCDLEDLSTANRVREELGMPTFEVSKKRQNE